LAAVVLVVLELELGMELAVVPVVVAHRARPSHRLHTLADPQTPVMRGNNRLTSPRLDPLNVPSTFESAATFSDIARALSTPIYVTI
jgi:hypothetical protein